MTFDRSKPFGVVHGGAFAGCFDQGGNLYHPDGRMVAGNKEEADMPDPKPERKPRAAKLVETPADAQIDAQLNG